jgi:hypothetical protein
MGDRRHRDGVRQGHRLQAFELPADRIGDIVVISTSVRR